MLFASPSRQKGSKLPNKICCLRKVRSTKKENVWRVGWGRTGSFAALVRCLGREISFSVLKNSFCVLRNLLLRTKNLLFGTNFIESEFLQSCFIMHFCSFCVIKYRPTLMKNKVWVYRCCVMYFFLFKHQNTAENDHFYAVNSQLATLVVFTAGM